ncbi:MAG: protoporphyrinogen/coproporphyrinogen oxidase [Bdellovibrionales bacterium]
MKKQITIVGGGFSGLTLAYCLHKLGYEIRIYEKNQWGGLLQTQNMNGMYIEEAANAILWTPHLEELCKSIGCQLVSPLPQARNKWIWKNKLTRWPLGFVSSLKLVVFLLRFLFQRSTLKPLKGQTIQEWTLRHLNREILDYLVSPGLQGIYAGDPQKLSASLILSSLFRKRTPKGGSVAPNKGMGELINQLKNYLESHNIHFEIRDIQSLNEIQTPLVLATSLNELLRLRPELNNEKLDFLNLVRVTTDFEKNTEHKMNGFGVLFPPNEKFNSLGALSNSDIFEFNQDNFNESWLMGGAHKQEVTELSEREIKNQVQADRLRALKDSTPFKNFFVKKHHHAYVHYDLHLESWLNKNKDRLQEDSQLRWTTGNFLGKLGLSQILEQNLELANRIYGVLCQKK